MAYERKTIYVYESWSGPDPRFMGTLYAEQTRGAEHFSFEYAEEYLREERALIAIDPELMLLPGRQYVMRKPNFGVFSDSAPDRWGRTLMDRKERSRARRVGEKPRKLTESDYLLGLCDKTRMGALRFATEKGGPFLSNDEEDAVPPWASLRTLEEASRQFEKDENGLNDQWLNQLLQPGSSLGGARPKATIQAVDGSLWIAKFPSKHDEFNTGAWEKTTHELAERCGLNVPPARLETFTRNGSTFLVKRFDREGERRVHFASAMTLLGKTDGASSTDGSGYYEMAEFLRAGGCNPKEDLLELWKRIVFNMSVSNTDDHLRNHGFLLKGKGWRLSPAYDVNPVPYGNELSLNVSPGDNTIDVDLAIETCDYYGLNRSEAERLAERICCIVRESWEAVAVRYGIGRSEIEEMRPAFLASEWHKT